MEENKEEYPQKIKTLCGGFQRNVLSEHSTLPSILGWFHNVFGIVQTGSYIPKPAETDVLGIAVRNIEEEEVY